MVPVPKDNLRDKQGYIVHRTFNIASAMISIDGSLESRIVLCVSGIGGFICTDCIVVVLLCYQYIRLFCFVVSYIPYSLNISVDQLYFFIKLLFFIIAYIQYNLLNIKPHVFYIHV